MLKSLLFSTLCTRLTNDPSENDSLLCLNAIYRFRTHFRFHKYQTVSFGICAPAGPRNAIYNSEHLQLRVWKELELLSKMTDIAPTCPYCQRKAILVDSAEIYGRSYGMAWLCRPCDAYVRTHKNSKRHAPLGRLANADLRHWKKQAHAAFDPIWQHNTIKECSTRAAAYSWLSERLGIDVRRCHIGEFNVEQCKRVVAICATLESEPSSGI